jgi:polar amino acid transport system substrate-binding protein
VLVLFIRLPIKRANLTQIRAFATQNTMRQLFVLIIASAIQIPGGTAENIRVGFYNYPPYMIERDKSGIYQDIFEKLGELTNDTFDIQYYPYPRLKALFNSKEIDVEPGVNPSWVNKQKNPGVFSLPVGKVVGVLVFGPSKRFPVKEPDDLSGKVLGLVTGYAYPNIRKFLDSGEIIHGRGEDEHQLMEMLSNGRFDQILIGQAVAQYLIRENGRYSNLELGNQLGSYDVNMRVQESKKIFLLRLNLAIEEMHKLGEFETIYSEYGATWK